MDPGKGVGLDRAPATADLRGEIDIFLPAIELEPLSKRKPPSKAVR
jgi:hypothetical protein